MSEVTNELVGKGKRLGLGAGALLTAALAVSVFCHEGSVRAATTASPLDDNSVAALTALDNAVESVATRVSPAVVNVAVTSKGSEEQTAMEQQGGQQGPGQGQG